MGGYGGGSWEVSRQLNPGGVVDTNAGRSDVLGQVLSGPGAGDEQDIGCEVEQPGERDLRRGGAQAAPRGRRGRDW